MYYALKFVAPDTEQAKQELIDEIGRMRSVQSDYIVKCIDAYDFTDRLWIILEMMEAGQLTKIIVDRQGDYTESFVKYALYCVAQALKALHDKNMLHRDIKSDNVLVKFTGEIKIADMGFSVYLTKENAQRDSQKGTPSWMAPEVVQGHSYSKEVDIWSLGVFAYEMATGHPPFNDQENSNIFNDIQVMPIPRLEQPKWSPSFQSFIDRCLERNPASRASIEQLLAHDFLKHAANCKTQFVKEFNAWSQGESDNSLMQTS